MTRVYRTGDMRRSFDAWERRLHDFVHGIDREETQMKIYDQKEVDAAERRLAKRTAALAEVRAWAAAQPQVAGRQAPGRWEVEQAENAVRKAETTLRCAQRRPKQLAFPQGDGQ